MLSVATRPHEMARARREAAPAPLRLGGRGARLRHRAGAGRFADLPGRGLAAHRIGAADPGALALGLRRGAGARGALVRADAGGGRDGRRRYLRTPGGLVRADQVLLATGAYPPLVGAIRRLVAPVYDYVIVTEQLTATRSGARSAGRAARGSRTAATASTTTGSRPTAASCSAGTRRSTGSATASTTRRLSRHPPTGCWPAPARDVPGARGDRRHPRLGRADRHLQPVLRDLRARARRPGGVRRRLHRPGRRRQPLPEPGSRSTSSTASTTSARA